jgi:hypothetical protein
MSDLEKEIEDLKRRIEKLENPFQIVPFFPYPISPQNPYIPAQPFPNPMLPPIWTSGTGDINLNCYNINICLN